jgi:hypothetical protein
VSAVRLTVAGSPAFESELQQALLHLAGDVQRVLGHQLVALLLGGGYGRGEGAVVRHQGRERPYNDLDLTLVVTQRRLPLAALDAVRHDYQCSLGIDVDFSRPLTPAEIRAWPATLMWHELYHGHQVLHGATTVLDAAPACVVAHPPPVEAVRLLLNRGAGLLWALRVARAVEPAPDEDFVRRNGYKAALAAGDALMIAHGCHAVRYQGRDQRLAMLAVQQPLISTLAAIHRYSTALQFKLEPDALARGCDESWLRELACEWSEVLLYIERRRHHNSWATLAEYAAWSGVREHEQHRLACWPRNIVHGLQQGRITLRHARERLYQELPALLHLTRQSERDWERSSAAWLDCWRRCN